MNDRAYKTDLSRTELFKASHILLLLLHTVLRIYYLDDQVDVWGRVGDGEDGRSGQRGLIRVRSVRFQEVFKLVRVQITVEVLWYLEGDGDEEFNFWEPEKRLFTVVTFVDRIFYGHKIKEVQCFPWKIEAISLEKCWVHVNQRLILEYYSSSPLRRFSARLPNDLRLGTQPYVLVWPGRVCVMWSYSLESH